MFLSRSICGWTILSLIASFCFAINSGISKQPCDVNDCYFLHIIVFPRLVERIFIWDDSKLPDLLHIMN